MTYIFVCFLYIIRQTIRNHALHTIFAAILRCLLIIPVLEFQHVQNLFMWVISASRVFLMDFKDRFSQEIGEGTLHAPVHKLLNILDFKTGFLQTLNNP